MNKILVIKHGSLGDIIQATEAFRAIREANKNDKIAIMTRKAFAGFAKTMPFFNEVIIDKSPKINIINYYKTIKTIASFDKVYDLQHSKRTARYFKLLNLFSKIPISTIPAAIDRNISAFCIFKEQLKNERINDYGQMPCLDFMQDNIDLFNLPKDFALIIAGCSLRGVKKQWTAEGFASVARYLIEKNIIPVFIGTKHDAKIIDNIIKLTKEVSYINLCGKTNLNQIASMGRKAVLAVAIDTGPAHIIAGVGCKIFILFNTKYTNAKKSLAIGKNVIPIELKDLSLTMSNIVIDYLRSFLAK